MIYIPHICLSALLLDGGGSSVHCYGLDVIDIFIDRIANNGLVQDGMGRRWREVHVMCSEDT